MNSFFPDDPKKLKTRIRSYERSLSRDQDDGFGKRFLLGPMYLLLGDVEGALRHFDWYEQTFTDDSAEPANHLCWTLALFKAGKMDAARHKFKQTMFANLYLIPLTMGDHPEALDIWHGINWAKLPYAMEIPPELLRLWDDAARAWARSLWNEPEIVHDRARFIEVERALKDAPAGPRRSALVQESMRIRNPATPHLRIVR